MDVDTGDIIIMKKKHPCGGFEFLVLGTGMDFKLKCLGCGHVVMLQREKALKAITTKIEKNI